MNSKSLLDLSYDELQEIITCDGLAAPHAKSLWRHLHQKAGGFSDQERAFLPPLQRWVDRETAPNGRFPWYEPTVAREMASSDGLTRKFLLRLKDGALIETVLMGYPGRYTACLSTQVGCAMGCVFCATGQSGFTRHLQPSEIVGQVLHLQRFLRSINQPTLRNLVLMGMGEPLHNYDAVLAALRIIIDTRGINIGPRRITISTVGVIPGILRLAGEPESFNLAVSLHASDQSERAALIPTAKRWGLDDLIAACRTYGQLTQRRIFVEWTLIEGKNDSREQAKDLAKLLHGIDAHINLIPLNPTVGYHGNATTSGEADAFQAILQEAGFPSTIRQRRGIDVAAGCGQLAAAF